MFAVFGTPGQIRTDTAQILSLSPLPIGLQGLCLVPTSGIEPLSTVLQTAAMTTSARLVLFGAPTKNRTWNTSLPRMRYAIYL
jgi:hypothetical protein